MKPIDGQLLQLFRRLEPRQKLASLIVTEIVVAGMNGQTKCPAARTERERELLRLVREPGGLPAALPVALEVVAAYTSSGGGGGNGWR